ncbi:Crp/Fnr family transcriptional regulator [Methylococcus sp. EFPC2]|uniref:Crp/Fnr family transcriptional regulator n=1 Tax=Methylococcus sp. EFPC2 TaxID=2812648 RepID=UPI001967117C|nr:cyclic nucleotide-binding domain-containing protein [Methylococcus sp. EFPC2]QSA98806.1 cyclic nucleotide-binding domain-containing protein [Methylococcus sp. EFPC2]
MSGETEGKFDSVFYELLARQDFEEGRCWQRRSYRNNEIILREGGHSGKVFLVLEGVTRILGSVAVGDDYQVRPGVRDLGPGSVFGELSLLDQAPHAATVLAVADCTVAEIDDISLRDYLDRNREFGFCFYRQLALLLVERLRKTDKQLFATLAWGLKAHGYDKYMKPDA